MKPEPFFNTAISIDILLLTVREAHLEVLLIQRTEPPSVGEWSLPGNLVAPDESVEDSVNARILELTGWKDLKCEPMGAFTDVDRHPLGRVVTLATYAPVRPDAVLKGRQGAPRCHWFPLDGVPSLPFDHNLIISKVPQQLRKDLSIKPIAFDMLPEKFTLGELQEAYEAIYEETYDKRNFSRRAKSSPLLHELNEKRKPTGGAGKWATLYTFQPENFHLQFVNKTGFNF